MLIKPEGCINVNLFKTRGKLGKLRWHKWKNVNTHTIAWNIYISIPFPGPEIWIILLYMYNNHYNVIIILIIMNLTRGININIPSNFPYPPGIKWLLRTVSQAEQAYVCRNDAEQVITFHLHHWHRDNCTRPLSQVTKDHHRSFFILQANCVLHFVLSHINGFPLWQMKGIKCICPIDFRSPNVLNKRWLISLFASWCIYIETIFLIE